MDYSTFVKNIFKPGEEIVEQFTPVKAEGIHAAVGVAGEAGEVLDLIKKVTFNNRTLDLDKLRNELGDVEYYLEALRQTYNITRDECIAANVIKLSKRYEGGYSDQKSLERKDVA